METSKVFKGTATSVRREMQCRKYKMIAAAIVAIIVSSRAVVDMILGSDFDHHDEHLWYYFFKVFRQELNFSINFHQ